MTGFRVGNPKRVRTKGICLSCGEERFYKCRRLCETCWAYAKKTGTMENFPTVHQRHVPHPSGKLMRRCGCFSPIEDSLGAWGVQCLKCGRPIIK